MNDTAPALRPLDRVASTHPYQAPSREDAGTLALDANEGLTPHPGLIAALDAAALQRYPSSEGLAAAFSARHGVARERALVTAGVDDALDRLCRAYLDPGRTALFAEPTFEMVPRYVALTGARARTVPWRGGAFPLEAHIAALSDAPALAFVVSPNNPSGAVASCEELLRFALAARGRTLVVVDLAYVEFADEDPTPGLLAEEHVVVLRTLSKAWGLAGLRVGCALGAPQVLDAMRRVGQPYAVAGPSVRWARAWLERGEDAVREHCAAVRGERAELSRWLATRGFAVEPSQANFVLARRADARELYRGLLARGVRVRAWPTRAALSDALRISCPGRPADFSRLMTALAAVVEA